MSSWFNSFFAGEPGGFQVEVEAELLYPNNIVSAPRKVSFHIEPTQEQSTVQLQTLEVAVDGNNYQATTATIQLPLPTALSFRVEKLLASLTSSQLSYRLNSGSCAALSPNFTVTEVSQLGKNYFVFTPNAAIKTALSQSGQHTLEVNLTTSCGTPSANLTLDLNLVQTTGYALRFHYRDHLASSWLSERYSTQASDQGLGSLQLGSRTLYNQGIELTDFTPYGEPLQAVQNTEDPKYTGHEYDKMTGMNYMKRRYQLASQAKLNRPDPMRDWDWYRPQTLNLYEYVRNNPISNWAPTGESALGKGVIFLLKEVGKRFVQKQALSPKQAVRRYINATRSSPVQLVVKGKVGGIALAGYLGSSTQAAASTLGISQENQPLIKNGFIEGMANVESLGKNTSVESLTGGSKFGMAVDLFNPLSLIKDVSDVYLTLSEIHEDSSSNESSEETSEEASEQNADTAQDGPEHD